MGLVPSVCVLTAEAKAAEAAASAYYNPGNPHNVYMPTVSGAGTRWRGTHSPSCWYSEAGETSPCSDSPNMIFPFFLRTSLHHLPTTPLKIRRPSRPRHPLLLPPLILLPSPWG